jgi:protein-tyrosine sulfotransferase
MVKLNRRFGYVLDFKNLSLLLSFLFFLLTQIQYEKYIVERDKLKTSLENIKTKEKENLTKKTPPIVFIGGSPRSGTTLMRVMLDAHPMVRCGEETRIIPRFIDYMHSILEKEQSNSEAINAANGAYIYEIIRRHGRNASYLCTKDPTTLEYSEYLASLFPNAKFILMIRDARATVHSVDSRYINSGGYQIKNLRENFENWNKLIENMYSQCIIIGSERCLPVYYEQLVLHPEQELRKILSFLNLQWNDRVLSHEKFIGSKISLSKTEKSSDQVVKPINLEGLDLWFDKIPEDILNDIDLLAPMLKKLGYDTKSKKPNYGDADQKIRDNTLQIKANRDYWRNISDKYSELNKYFVKMNILPQ